jgi:hypothetical protein
MQYIDDAGGNADSGTRISDFQIKTDFGFLAIALHRPQRATDHY